MDIRHCSEMITLIDARLLGVLLKQQPANKPDQGWLSVMWEACHHKALMRDKTD